MGEHLRDERQLSTDEGDQRVHERRRRGDQSPAQLHVDGGDGAGLPTAVAAAADARVDEK